MIEQIKNTLYALLRKSERYTKTDMVYLARGGFWLGSGQTVSSILTFISAIAFANLLPKETYGIYKYVLSVFGILGIATLAEMETAVIQAVAIGREGVVKAALATRIRWGALGALGGLVAAVYYWQAGNFVLSQAFLIVSVFTPFIDTLGIYDPYFRGKKLFDTVTRRYVVLRLVSVLSIVATILLTDNLLAILFVYFASQTMMNGYFLYRTFKTAPPNEVADPDAVNYGKKLTGTAIIGTITSYLDKLLVFHYLGAAELAVYSFATAPAEQFKRFLSLFDYLALPKFAAGDTRAIAASMGGKFLRMFGVGVVMIGFYILAAPFVFKIFFPQYPEAIFYSQIFALGMLNVALTPAGMLLKAKRKITEQYVSNAVTSVFQIIVMWLFLFQWGLLGLVLARVATRYFGSLLNVYLYRRAFADTLPAVSPPGDQE